LVRFGLVFYIKTETQLTSFGLVRFGFGSVSGWFGYFILKTKNYIIFWVLFWTFLMGLVSVWFGLFFKIF
jgi:hypothetical protein